MASPAQLCRVAALLLSCAFLLNSFLLVVEAQSGLHFSLSLLYLSRSLNLSLHGYSVYQSTTDPSIHLLGISIANLSLHLFIFAVKLIVRLSLYGEIFVSVTDSRSLSRIHQPGLRPPRRRRLRRQQHGNQLHLGRQVRGGGSDKDGSRQKRLMTRRKNASKSPRSMRVPVRPSSACDPPMKLQTSKKFKYEDVLSCPVTRQGVRPVSSTALTWDPNWAASRQLTISGPYAQIWLSPQRLHLRLTARAREF